MPNCSLCGNETNAALVIHTECLRRAIEYNCTYNCKWVWVCEDKDRLAVHCASCPLNLRGGKIMIDRKFILEKALEITTGQREKTYGGPENSFTLIAELWEPYIRTSCVSPEADVTVAPEDVAVMMALLKVARLAYDSGHLDSWVDLAGYAACGGEIGCRQCGGGYENAE